MLMLLVTNSEESEITLAEPYNRNKARLKTMENCAKKVKNK